MITFFSRALTWLPGLSGPLYTLRWYPTRDQSPIPHGIQPTGTRLTKIHVNTMSTSLAPTNSLGPTWRGLSHTASTPPGSCRTRIHAPSRSCRLPSLPQAPSRTPQAAVHLERVSRLRPIPHGIHTTVTTQFIPSVHS